MGWKKIFNKPNKEFTNVKTADELYEAEETTTQQVKEANIVTFEPHSFEEVQYIADHLVNNRSSILNVSRLNDKQKMRAIDFLSGVVYTIDGSIQKLSPGLYLFAPKTMNITSHDDLIKGE